MFCVDLRTNSGLLRISVPYVTAVYSSVFTARYDLNLAVEFMSMLACTGHVVAQAVSRRPATTEARVRSRTSPSEICDVQNGPSTGPSSGTSRLRCQCHPTSAPCVLFLQEKQTGEAWEHQKGISSRIFGRMARILGRMAHILGRMARIVGRMAHILGRLARIEGRMAHILDRMARIVGRMAHILGRMARRVGRMAHICVEWLALWVEWLTYWVEWLA